ncbi:MAG: hypothetical protein QM497_01580 [Sulfurimonas sp.]
MKRINPLHIGVLLIVFLLFFTLKLSTLKDTLKNEKKAYRETVQIATKLQGLKAVYADKIGVKKSLNRVLHQRVLKSANIEKKFNAKGVVLSAEAITLRQLNYFMGKILNGSYRITLLKIKRISKEKASLKLKIKW